MHAQLLEFSPQNAQKVENIISAARSQYLLLYAYGHVFVSLDYLLS